MNKKLLVSHIAAFAVFAFPAILLAHGGVDDGHLDEPTVTKAAVGASALLVAFSPAWWGLLFVCGLITAGLSFLVFKYLQVAPVVRKSEEKKPETPK